MRTPEVKRPRSGVRVRNRGLSKPITLTGNRSMKRKLLRPAAGRNDGGLLLFDSADARYDRRPSYAVRYLQNCLGYSTATARLIAGLAGLCVEED